MRRRFRRQAFGSSPGSFPATALSPLFRTVAFLIVLALVYSWAKNPQSWRFLENNTEESTTVTSAEKTVPAGEPGPVGEKKAAPSEPVVSGSTDQNEAEAASARGLFEAVSDRSPLAKIEMPAYWRCLKWARAQSFADLDRRALRGVIFTQFWEQPDKYRGKLVRLRLHIRRMLTWEASDNPAGVSRVYEAWGWTDDSKSFPYVVVLTDVPKNIPLGDNIQQEGLFVGYFLKTMAYTAFNKNRSSPLLLGRMKWLDSAPPAHPIMGHNDWIWIGLVGALVAAVIGLSTWLRMRRFGPVKLTFGRGKPTPEAPADEAEMESWYRNSATPSSADPPQDRL